MAGPPPSGPAPAPGAVQADPDRDLLARNGIVRVAVYQYRVDGYCYANLADAIAQVRRGSLARAAAERPSGIAA